MIVRAESTIIDFQEPFDQGFKDGSWSGLLPSFLFIPRKSQNTSFP